MTMNIIPVRNEQTAIEDVKRLANIVLTLRNDVLKANVDYGVIPGTGTKPTLLLPGMEKLMRALRLRPEYNLLSSKEDFDKPLFYYRYECRMVEVDTAIIVSAAIGSANSMEGKWRWRKAGRACPNCGKETIIKGKTEYGGGWICFKGKGGCGAKFADNAQEIISQPEGRVPNEDIFDQINTIDKIAQKRALSSAIKGAANVSEFFTVDLDDLQRYDVVDVEYTEIAPNRVVDSSTGEIVVTVPAAPVKTNEAPKPVQKWNRKIVQDRTEYLFAAVQHFNNAVARLESDGKITPDMDTEAVVTFIIRHYWTRDETLYGKFLALLKQHNVTEDDFYDFVGAPREGYKGSIEDAKATVIEIAEAKKSDAEQPTTPAASEDGAIVWDTVYFHALSFNLDKSSVLKLLGAAAGMNKPHEATEADVAPHFSHRQVMDMVTIAGVKIKSDLAKAS